MVIEWDKVTWYSKLAAVILFVGVFELGFYLGKEFEKTSPQISDRQEMIHVRGAHVMPFDLNKTKHFFKKTDDGGLETVLSLDPNDSHQIMLIQLHLQEEADKFSKGDFSDPTSLHGTTMPGLNDLKDNFSKIEFVYRALSSGGEIGYTTREAELINVIHQYFNAQVSNHGTDAVGY